MPFTMRPPLLSFPTPPPDWDVSSGSVLTTLSAVAEAAALAHFRAAHRRATRAREALSSALPQLPPAMHPAAGGLAALETLDAEAARAASCLEAARTARRVGDARILVAAGMVLDPVSLPAPLPHPPGKLTPIVQTPPHPRTGAPGHWLVLARRCPRKGVPRWAAFTPDPGTPSGWRLVGAAATRAAVQGRPAGEVRPGRRPAPRVPVPVRYLLPALA